MVEMQRRGRTWELFRRGVEWTVLEDGLFKEEGLDEEEWRKIPGYMA